jgi:hypothetical protein
VHNGNDAIASELNVTLENFRAGLQSHLERDHRVLRRATGIATVGDQEGAPIPAGHEPIKEAPPSTVMMVPVM